jgi:hypothetical protein
LKIALDRVIEMTINRDKEEGDVTTLENFGERKLQKIFADDKNPLVVKVGELIEKKASIEDIVRAAKIAAEQRGITNEETK